MFIFPPFFPVFSQQFFFQARLRFWAKEIQAAVQARFFSWWFKQEQWGYFNMVV